MSDRPTLNEITEQFKERVTTKKPFGHTAKLVLEGEGAVFIDATDTDNAIVISNEDKDADCTLKMSMDTLEKMGTGELDGMNAFMQGLLVIEGDQNVAMMLGDILAD